MIKFLQNNMIWMMVSPVKENKAGYRGSGGGVCLNIEGSRNLEEIKEQVGQYLSNRSPGGGRVKAKALRKGCAQPVQGTADPALGEAREGSRVGRTERQAEVGDTKAVRGCEISSGSGGKPLESFGQ